MIAGVVRGSFQSHAIHRARADENDDYGTDDARRTRVNRGDNADNARLVRQRGGCVCVRMIREKGVRGSLALIRGGFSTTLTLCRRSKISEGSQRRRTQKILVIRMWNKRDNWQ